jgi:hypothetical protein
MVGNHIRAELQRPLEGNRRIVTEQRGQFTLRIDPEHVAQALAARRMERVLEDIARFRVWTNRTRNLGAVQDLS